MGVNSCCLLDLASLSNLLLLFFFFAEWKTTLVEDMMAKDRIIVGTDGLYNALSFCSEHSLLLILLLKFEFQIRFLIIPFE